MSEALYLTAAAVKETGLAYQTQANNIANSSKAGFKQDVNIFKTVYSKGQGFETRAYPITTTSGIATNRGAYNHTGNEFDLTTSNDAWMVFEQNGRQYINQTTHLTRNQDGEMVDEKGGKLMTTNGALTLPETSKLAISQTGVVSILTPNGGSTIPQRVGLVMLVKAEGKDVQRNEYGEIIPKNPAVFEEQYLDGEVNQGFLEASNVNSVESMAIMIQLQNQNATLQHMMKSAYESSNASNSLIRLN